ncbi:MAG: HD domain-containing protein [Melioribacteraceae bacterium]|nr:MAG: HD domain-containing protein [Melioribacteraceae bacterium]
MSKQLQIKQEFLEEREKLFNNENLVKDSFKFCVRYSLLVEEYIIKILKGIKLKGSLASVGSFSRRELSPFSDIDVMFIFEKVKGNEEAIQECVTKLWDGGIEVSHTVREFSDLKRFLKEDLHAFTQFFETRFIYGDDKTYADWTKKVFTILSPKDKVNLILEFFEDIKQRHQKYGESAKVLEPNVKFTAGGLRDIHVVEWMYSLKNNFFLADQNEETQTQIFLKELKDNNIIAPAGIERLVKSYKLILGVRNLLHLIQNRKYDRLEFPLQEKIGKLLKYEGDSWHTFMHHYFEAASVTKRFVRTMMKHFEEQITSPIPDSLAIELDEDFSKKGNLIFVHNPEKKDLSISDIMRAFYYRGLYDARFDENLRSEIIEISISHDSTKDVGKTSSVFFREILKLPKNIGKTLIAMNELGALSAFLPEFKDLVGFFQPGVYHCYTADEHTLIAVQNLEKLEGQEKGIGLIYNGVKEKDLLYLAMLLHDIAKPLSISGHEIIGSEIAQSIMQRIGYESEEIELVSFLVRHHLTMEQVAFRRNLNDAATLNNFTAIFPSLKALDYLYLVTYADLSAVSDIVWTKWKEDLLSELYRKSREMIKERITGEDLLLARTIKEINGRELHEDENIKEHLEAINDLSYLSIYSNEEINAHVAEIERDTEVSVFIKEEAGFTNITVITKDSNSLLSRLCGALAINDLNIHDAKIFTRKDGIVIDSFNVTDYRSQKPVDKSRYEKIIERIEMSVENKLELSTEFDKIRNKWWRIEKKLFKKKPNIKILFEKHEKFTIIDVYSPDRLGLLYRVTKKMNELGLSIYFAKIATKSDDVVDAFYTLDRNGNKVSSHDYDLIKLELTNTIEEMM